MESELGAEQYLHLLTYFEGCTHLPLRDASNVCGSETGQDESRNV